MLAATVFGAEWKVGLSRSKITPDEPVLMAGYASRKTPSTGVDADIWVKAMAIEDREGHVSVLVTADLLGFTRAMANEISRRLKTSRGLERADLLLNASHTHAGPMVAVDRVKEATDDPAVQQAVRRYVENLNDTVVRIAEEALDNRRPSSLSWGQGSARFPFNRREFTERGVILGVNPRGPVDRTVPVLRVSAPDGSPRAVVFGAGAHCVTLRGDNFRISGDYAGFAQAHVEEEIAGLQAMFVTGCAGDAAPHPRGGLPGAKKHGAELGSEVLRVLSGELADLRGPLQTRYREVDLPLAELTRADVEAMVPRAPSYRRYFTDQALSWMDEGKPLPKTYRAPFALWRFGDGLTLVAFSGETVIDFALMAERALGPLNLWPSGYNNEVYGYLVTGRILEEGGYETRGLYSGTPGLFSPATEKAVMDAVKAMATEVGRIGR